MNVEEIILEQAAGTDFQFSSHHNFFQSELHVLS